MKECYRCGIPETRALLFDVISKQGIVSVCRKCSFEEDLPIVKGMKETIKEHSNKNEKFELYRERKKRFFDRFIHKKEKSDVLDSQEKEIQKIVEKNYQKEIGHEPRKDLIRNFHWTIMRARRSKKLTQTQLAMAIGEPGIAIKLAEQGIIPKGKDLFIRKLENRLGIRILQKNEEIKTQANLNFDEITTKTLTIEDLKNPPEEEPEFEILGEREISKEDLEDSI